ncbi:MAG: DUF3140 domain-containing protein [Actinomycetes bacterium]
MHPDPEIDELWQQFHEAVNMTSKELREFLLQDSAQPGTQAVPDEVGDATSRGVLDILTKREMDLTTDDVAVMREVVDLVDREQPTPDSGRLQDSEWRRSLMRVGHDPLRVK